MDWWNAVVNMWATMFFAVLICIPLICTLIVAWLVWTTRKLFFRSKKTPPTSK